MIMNDIEFKDILSITKFFESPDSFVIPLIGGKGKYKLITNDKEKTFHLDVDRSGRIVLKFKNQIRKDSLPLVRIDVNGPPHSNPDGQTVSGTHIHIYREGYSGLSWAYELSDMFDRQFDETNVLDIFLHFCDYCNIKYEDINIQGVL